MFKDAEFYSVMSIDFVLQTKGFRCLSSE